MTGDFGKMVELKGGGVGRLWYFDGQKKAERTKPSSAKSDKCAIT